MARDLLVALDDSRTGFNALTYAVTQYQNANITVIHVCDESTKQTNKMSSDENTHLPPGSAVEKAFNMTQDIAAKYKVNITFEIVYGDTADEIVEFAEREFVDNIIVGSHNRTGLDRLLKPSVAESVVRKSNVPVTVV